MKDVKFTMLLCQMVGANLVMFSSRYARLTVFLFQSDLERLLADAEKRLAWLQSENEGIDSSDKVGGRGIIISDHWKAIVNESTV